VAAADICGHTGLLEATGWDARTRRKLSLIDTIEGWRGQLMATDTPPLSVSFERRHCRPVGRHCLRLRTVEREWIAGGPDEREARASAGH
jgi:hypothetical protein